MHLFLIQFLKYICANMQHICMARFCDHFICICIMFCYMSVSCGCIVTAVVETLLKDILGFCSKCGMWWWNICSLIKLWHILVLSSVLVDELLIGNCRVFLVNMGLKYCVIFKGYNLNFIFISSCLKKNGK